MKRQAQQYEADWHKKDQNDNCNPFQPHKHNRYIRSANLRLFALVLHTW
jgi:hypothetical protein